MHKFPLPVFYLCLLAVSLQAQLPPVGDWREHLSYQQARGLALAGDQIYCATPYALFRVDPADNSIERFSKINGLHEVGVQAIGWDPQGSRLVISYTNSDLDILSGGQVYNINAILQKDVPADKTIYNIFCHEGLAYLSTGLGLIVVDETRSEIGDTYVIGSSGAFIQVTGCSLFNNRLYAATAEGLKSAPTTAVNLSDYRSWQPETGLPPGACSDVFTLQGILLARCGDSLFRWVGGNWNFFFSDGSKLGNTTVSSGKLLLCEKLGSQARVRELDSSAVVLATIDQPGLLSDPRQAILFNNSIWVADGQSGLLEFSSGTVRRYQPNSPYSVATGELAATAGLLWAAAGSVNADWTNQYSRNGLFRFEKGEWTNYNSQGQPSLDSSLYDFMTAAIDPRDQSLWAGSFGGGLLQIRSDNTQRIFRQPQVPPSAADPAHYFISGLAFDQAQNLWIADYGATQSLLVRKADSSWGGFSPPFFLTNNAVSQVLVDDYDQVWVVSPGGNGLICFNHGASLSNPGDDRWRLLKTGAGNGNLPSNNVWCIAKDKSGFIWVGTSKGVGLIQCAQDIFSSGGCEAVLPIVQQDNFAGYLFSDEQVQCIAVDGADRKWVGSLHGVWLISPDGEKTLYHFTAANSPLLDNDVRHIAIDPQSGEVFFATASGICSFRSTATEASASGYGQVLVFPNPVPPGYTGTIAIRGLVDNAIVKITELNGRLVYQTRALGGQAVWNGKNYKGENVATGVYLVLVSDDSRQQNLATKIVFINK